MNTLSKFFMKHSVTLLFTLFLSVVFIPNYGEAQSRSRSRGKTISVTNSLNIRQKSKPYTFHNERQEQSDTLLLRYLTSSSGVFSIKEGDPYTVVRNRKTSMPSITFSLGGSVRILNNDNYLFQEFALTRFVIGKQEEIGTIVLELPEGDAEQPLGFSQRFTHIGIRYSVGKYFVKNRKSKFRFGLSGGIETSVFAFEHAPYVYWGQTLKGTIFSIELSIQPQLSFRLSKYVSLELNPLFNFLVADFGQIAEGFTTSKIAQTPGEREYEIPDITMGFGVALNYTIKNTGSRR